MLPTRCSHSGTPLSSGFPAYSLLAGFILYSAGNFAHVLQRKYLFRLAKRRLIGILMTAYNCLKEICEDIRAKLSSVVLDNIAKAMTTDFSSEDSDWRLGKPFLPGG